MKKLLTVALALTLFLCVFAGCGKQVREIRETDIFAVLTPDDSFVGKTLEEFMASEKTAGRFEYTINGGFVTSVIGIENAADFSVCWMLYTDDTENTNEAWGVVSYKGTRYASATLGATELVIAKGRSYMWLFTKI